MKVRCYQKVKNHPHPFDATVVVERTYYLTVRTKHSPTPFVVNRGACSELKGSSPKANPLSALKRKLRR